LSFCSLLLMFERKRVEDRRENRERTDRQVDLRDLISTRQEKPEDGRIGFNRRSEREDWKVDRDRLHNLQQATENDVNRDAFKRENRDRKFSIPDGKQRPHFDFKNQAGYGRGRDQDGNQGRVGIVTRKPMAKVDRKKICPFLMRVFPSHGQHHPINQFQNGAVPGEELSIYTWQDAKLKDIAELVKQSYPDANKLDVTLSFARVFPDNKSGEWNIKEIGKIGSKFGSEEFVSLYESGFNISDFMDVAVIPQTSKTFRSG